MVFPFGIPSSPSLSTLALWASRTVRWRTRSMACDTDVWDRRPVCRLAAARLRGCRPVMSGPGPYLSPRPRSDMRHETHRRTHAAPRHALCSHNPHSSTQLQRSRQTPATPATGVLGVPTSHVARRVPPVDGGPHLPRCPVTIRRFRLRNDVAGSQAPDSVPSFLFSHRAKQRCGGERSVDIGMSSCPKLDRGRSPSGQLVGCTHGCMAEAKSKRLRTGEIAVINETDEI